MVASGVLASFRRILGAAKTYLYQNYNVIPIWGNLNPERAKVASVDWKVYQQRRVTQSDLENWLHQEKFGGLAIITGRISRLIVLDFDDEILAKEFARRYPHLTKTRTILSAGRNLPHYYYHIPLNATVESHHANGVDLQAEGRYVIAPPTIICDKAYKILQGGEPRVLTNVQIDLILRFIDEQSARPHESSQNQLISPNIELRENISPQDAIGLYRYYALQLGRNEALFRTACQLRDVGWLKEDVFHCLAMIHREQLPSRHHPPESNQQRLREAQTTIHSAFTRPPRKPRPINSDSPQTLPNSIREHLLQHNQTALVRVLDGLLMNNMTQGTLLTEREICDVLKGQVGRFSILKALAETYEDGTAIFTVHEAENPFPGPLSHTIVATANAGDSNNKCVLFRATKPNKNQKGRPAKTYFVPRIEILCAQFGLKFTQSDPITKEDLRSSKTYRQALNREFIRRRPGLYPRKWLAKRLGITKRTSQRYQHEDIVKYKAMYYKQFISWDNLGQISDMPDIMGVFLQDETGKRYPPNRELAKKLLADGHTLTYMRQDVNYYWHPHTPPGPLVTMGIHPKSPEKAEISRFTNQHDLGESSIQKSLKNAQNSENDHEVRDERIQKTPKLAIEAKDYLPETKLSQKIETQSKRYYRQALPDELQESAAQRLYKKVRSRCQDKEGYLSIAVARKLTEQYGAAQIRRLIQLLSWRDAIENPAGFSVVWLRSEAKRTELEQMMR
jgi:hypothetical protein